MPTLTVGSPASRRKRVGTVTPMRWAQVFRDSLRRSLATARSAPSFSSAASVEGGNCWMARGGFGIQIEYIEKAYFDKFYFNSW